MTQLQTKRFLRTAEICFDNLKYILRGDLSEIEIIKLSYKIAQESIRDN